VDENRRLTMLELEVNASDVYCDECAYWVPEVEREKATSGQCCRHPIPVATSDDHGCGEFRESYRAVNSRLERTDEDLAEDYEDRQNDFTKRLAALGLAYVAPRDGSDE
jgi:hypothetical protein